MLSWVAGWAQQLVLCGYSVLGRGLQEQLPSAKFTVKSCELGG